MVIPVEVKTGKTPRFPYENHKMQLWAYCLLVEENYAAPPPFGCLRYPENDFQIPYTKREREKVEQVVAHIPPVSWHTRNCTAGTRITIR